jgi:NAD-dependent protein deacetylase/lipoamidase
LADVDQLAELLRSARGCVALTGAGVSTESGIPDFRSPTGIWAKYDPREYATIDAFETDPEKVWRFYTLRYRMLLDAEPNDAHHALAELERRDIVTAVITQNIDLLHERAGSKDVIEVHGSIRECICLACGSRYPLDEVLRQLETATVPRCTCRAILKPGVVMFGELLDPESIDRAFRLAREADALLVVGSTLEVQPVAGLPWETVTAGGDVAIVNLGPTAFDARAALKIDGKAGEVLRSVVERLGA